MRFFFGPWKDSLIIIIFGLQCVSERSVCLFYYVFIICIILHRKDETTHKFWFRPAFGSFLNLHQNPLFFAFLKISCFFIFAPFFLCFLQLLLKFLAFVNLEINCFFAPIFSSKNKCFLEKMVQKRN